MYATPYDTTAGKTKLEPGTVEKMSSYLIVKADDKEGQLIKTDRGDSATGIFRLIPGSADIPTFSQPLLVELASGARAYVADVRPFVTVSNPKNQEIKINSPGLYDSIMDRLVMQVMWDERGPERLLSLGIIGMTMFQRWIVNTLHRLKLDENTQYQISIIASYYYYCLHEDNADAEFSQIMKSRIIGLIRRATGADMGHIKQIIDSIGIVRNVRGFISAIQDQTQSSRLAGLNEAGLFTLIGATLVGHDPRLTACIALEHPPTFIAMLHGALNYKGAQRSGFGEIVKRVMHGRDAQEFNQAYAGLIKEFK